MSTLNFKIVLLGEGRVGKTSILLRYIKNTYTDGQASTIQASFLTKVLSVPDNSNKQSSQISSAASSSAITSNPSNISSASLDLIDMNMSSASSSSKNQTQVKLSIWDTAGQERFHSLGPIYYRDASGAVLVYDITDASSFIRVQSWVKELRKMVGEADKLPIILVGNKCDLESQRQVDETEVLEYAQKVEALHLLVSAKMAINIEKVFLELTRRMMVQRKKRIGDKQAVNAFGGVVGKKQKLVILPPGEVPPTVNQNSCC